MKKKILFSTIMVIAIFIFALGIISVSADTIDSGICGTNLTWVLDDNGTLIISGEGNMTNWDSSSRAPWYDNRKNITNIVIENGITSIGSYAFYYCSNLKNVTIGNDVESIGNYAFYYCAQIKQINWNAKNVADFSLNNYIFADAGDDGDGTSVIFGDNVERIPAYLFYPYSALYSTSSVNITNVSIGANVKSIGNYAFYKCQGITDIMFPYSVTSIGDLAFGECSGLIDITIGSGVKSIGKKAFYLCRNLMKVNIGYEVISIGDSAFENCYLLEKVIWNAKSVDNFQTDNGVFAYAGKNGDGIDVVFSDLVETIPDYAFCPHSSTSYTAKVISVTIGKNVTSIGMSAFYNCSAITNITMGDSVTNIGRSAFYGCSQITSITIPSSVTKIDNLAFYNCTALTKINWNAKKVSDFLQSNAVFADAGKNGDGIRVVFGNDVEEIPDYLFFSEGYSKYTPKITSVIFGDNVKSIGKNAFCNCVELMEVTIPESVTSIGNSAFKDCIGFTSFTIPKNITSIGNYAFYNCTSLTEIIWNAKSVFDFSMDNYVFGYAGQETDGISVTFGDDAEDIPSYLFYPYHSTYSTDLTYAPKITNIILGNNVRSIGNNAFKDCVGLTEIHIPESVTSIGNSAFMDCTGFTSITIPENVNSIGVGAFDGCTGLTQINWNAKSVNDFRVNSLVFANAGKNGDGINLIFGDNVEVIPDYAFCPYFDGDNYSANITNVTIGENVTSIGEFSFYRLKSLENINWNAKNVADFTNENHVFGYAGQDSSGISVVFGDNVESIPANIFESYAPSSAYQSYNYTQKITSITFGEKVKRIGNRAFYYCPLITCIIIPDSVTDIGAYAFYECVKLEKVVFGNGAITIGNKAFYNCAQLKDIVFGSGMINIGDHAFERCYSIVDATLSNNLTTIGEGAFSGCYGIKCLTLPENVTTIGNGAFSGCTSLVQINWNAKNVEDFSEGNSIFSNIGQEGEGINLIFGENVESIPAYAFSIPSSAPQITNIKIKNNVRNIGYGAFGACKYLLEFSVSENNSEFCSDGGVLFNKSKTILVLYPAGKEWEEYSVPNSVTTIREYAFANCSNLNRIDISDNVTSIGAYAFYNCDGITNIIIPDSVTIISEAMFYDCSGLTQVIIGDSVKSIGQWAFVYCAHLKSINISGNLSSVGQYAFNSTALTDIYYKGTEDEWKSITIESYNNPLTNATVHYVEHTRTTLSDDGKTFTVNLSNIEIGELVILSLYDGGKFVEMQHAIYEGNDIPFLTTKTYTEAKVMVWNNWTNLKPVCDVEIVK